MCPPPRFVPPGLPFATCSLFLSEPLGAPKVLLVQGLAHLLDIAGDTSLSEPWPRVSH